MAPEFLGALARFFIVSKSEEELALEEENRQRMEETQTKGIAAPIEEQKKSVPQQQTTAEGRINLILPIFWLITRLFLQPNPHPVAWTFAYT